MKHSPGISARAQRHHYEADEGGNHSNNEGFDGMRVKPVERHPSRIGRRQLINRASKRKTKGAQLGSYDPVTDCGRH